MANPTLLSVPLCRDAEKNAIPVTDNGTTGKFSEQYGWQGINSLPLSAGGKAVERLDFNGVLALLGGIDYMTQRGYTFEYDNSLPYVAGCIVIDPLDGKTYRCINDVPIGASNPSNDPINWVSHDIADYVGGALRSTTYNVGDTSTLAGIPAGYFLECTTAGTTGAIAPVITPPVSAGQTITDGTVVWTVRQTADYQTLGYRQPSKAYSVGQMAAHKQLPFGWFLRCTTPGTTSAGDITIPSSLVVYSTITDGSVIWTITNLTTIAIRNIYGQNLYGADMSTAISDANLLYRQGQYKTSPSTTNLPDLYYGFIEVFADTSSTLSASFYMQRFTSLRNNKTYVRTVFHPSAQGEGWSAWSALN